MPHTQPEEHLARAVAAADEAARLLSCPDEDALARSGAALASARNCLGLCVNHAPSCPPASRIPAGGELVRLRRSLVRAKALIEHGEAFWEGWARVRKVLTAGYAAPGEPPAGPAPGGSLSAEG